MTPASRRKGWWGLGLILVLVILGGLYFSGLMPLPFGQPQPKALCYVSPKNPNYIKEAPGKDPEGHELMPVYATPTGTQKPTGPAVAVAPQAERKIKHWVSSMDPTYVRDKPGKDYMNMDLVPVYEEAPAPAAPVPGAAAGPQKERKIKYWVSPMDPGYVRDKPGKAPCGMDMVPVYEDVGEEAPGTIKVSAATIQSMGVRTAKVEVRPLSRLTLAVGLVTFNERNLATVTTKVNGWVERLYVNATGDPVRKGQTLLSLYSPDLVSSQEEYLLAARNLKAMKNSPVKEMADGARRLAEASRRRLAYFDISAAQIDALERTGQVKKNLTLASPANGIVTKRMVTQGMYVQAGMPLLEVADLSTVWVDADIYQYELPWIKVGQPVTMTLDYMPGETFPGKIDYIYPYLKEATRTAKVRLRFPNPGLKLKPEMFAQVKIESPVTKPAVVVPMEAVLDTGLKQHVFIALGQGRFEPREVKLGVYGDGNNVREVISGLSGGEEVVTSAQFLLDSESRFREAVQMMMPGKESEGKPGGTPPAKPEMKTGGAPAPAATPPPAMPAGMKMEGQKEAPPAAMPPGHKH
ncbi:MAG: efflux RND transporter periplasmic adaptor subunit [Syntrophobacterales bacterium]|jgi:Cu(I)/Ag(I) efflux system membrane fusion protein/cobalt-zinc-cadmium efflux system membrane fusion protein|nr:efflux RND transporter periplasmic adaptor subunit [Syntrophobacterales bacterium]